ncbi:MAG: DUF3164 family protein [Bacteroidales bacterium]|nr:DUF3164 family protein [Bacteroidales bacterium]
MKQEIDLSSLSAEQLQEALAKKQKAEQTKREKEEKEYIIGRDASIMNLVDKALDLELRLQAFKEECHEVLEMQEIKLTEYGKMRKNSKGGFSLTHSNGTRRVTRLRRTEPLWDERAVKATEMIKEFLHDTVKKRNIKLFEILVSFIEKNKDGDLEYSRVMNLIKHEDKYDDPRWLEGLKLIKESFNYRLKGFGYEFKVTDKDERWRNIDLSFTSI